MLAVGALGWYLRLGPQLQLDASPLAKVPTQIGRWQSTDVPLASVVESELRADFNLQRAYLTPSGDMVWAYIGYYGTERGGRPEHTPRGCYTGAGWGIEATRTIEIDPSVELRANEYLVERNGEQRLVHFWYRSHRRTGILGGLDQNIDRLLGRLLDGRADGALVRVSTPIAENDATAARGRLLAFASLLDPLLADHWPTETLCGQNDPADCPRNPSSQDKEGSAMSNREALRPLARSALRNRASPTIIRPANYASPNPETAHP
jgi:EpsI family protein